MKQLMMFAEPASLTLAEGTVMHPTFHELKQAMMVDAMNAPAEQAPMVQPVAAAPPVPRKRKLRRKDINVSEATPF